MNYCQLVSKLNISLKDITILSIVARHNDKIHDCRIQELTNSLEGNAKKISSQILSKNITTDYIGLFSNHLLRWSIKKISEGKK